MSEEEIPPATPDEIWPVVLAWIKRLEDRLVEMDALLSSNVALPFYSMDDDFNPQPKALKNWEFVAIDAENKKKDLAREIYRLKEQSKNVQIALDEQMRELKEINEKVELATIERDYQESKIVELKAKISQIIKEFDISPEPE